MKIFLTGSEGFIGTHLKERLKKEGHIVIGFDNLSHPCKFKSGDFIEGNIEHIFDYAPIISNCDYVIHLAAQINVEKSLVKPRETLITNLIGTFNLLQICTQYNIPIIFASTTEIYGDKKDIEKVLKFLTIITLVP